MSLQFSTATDLSDLDADFDQTCDDLRHLIPSSLPGGVSDALRPDPAYAASMEQIRSSCIDQLSATHAHLLDRNLNQWVDAANRVLAEQETAVRIAFHKFDMRSKVKSGFGLDFGTMDALRAVRAPYVQVLIQRSLPLAVVAAVVITLSPLPTLLAPAAFLGGGGVSQYLFNSNEKWQQLQQLSGLISELCKQQKAHSAERIEQARRRFDQVFADFCRQQGVTP